MATWGRRCPPFCGGSTAAGSAPWGKTLPPEQLPSAIIRRHFAITTSGVCDPIALAAAIAALGEDAVMFSVDYPYEDTSTAAAFIEAAPLGPAVRAKVCHGNAERILKL